jgi:hypothetical protein
MERFQNGQVSRRGALCDIHLALQSGLSGVATCDRRANATAAVMIDQIIFD